MKLCNPTLFSIVHRTQQADGTAGGQPTMNGTSSYLALIDIPLPLAKDMIDDIGEETGDDGVMRRPHRRSFPKTKTDSEQFEWML
jgi:hypothetical protein